MVEKCEAKVVLPFAISGERDVDIGSHNEAGRYGHMFQQREMSGALAYFEHL